LRDVQNARPHLKRNSDIRFALEQLVARNLPTAMVTASTGMGKNKIKELRMQGDFPGAIACLPRWSLAITRVRKTASGVPFAAMKASVKDFYLDPAHCRVSLRPVRTSDQHMGFQSLKTKTELYKEHCNACEANGLAPMSRTTFFESAPAGWTSPKLETFACKQCADAEALPKKAEDLIKELVTRVGAAYRRPLAYVTGAPMPETERWKALQEPFDSQVSCMAKHLYELRRFGRADGLHDHAAPLSFEELPFISPDTLSAQYSGEALAARARSCRLPASPTAANVERIRYIERGRRETPCKSCNAAVILKDLTVGTVEHIGGIGEGEIDEWVGRATELLDGYTRARHHLFEVGFQQHAFERVRDNLKVGELVMSVDFGAALSITRTSKMSMADERAADHSVLLGIVKSSRASPKPDEKRPVIRTQSVLYVCKKLKESEREEKGLPKSLNGSNGKYAAAALARELKIAHEQGVRKVTIFSDHGSGFHSHYFISVLSLVAFELGIQLVQSYYAPNDGKGAHDRYEHARAVALASSVKRARSAYCFDLCSILSSSFVAKSTFCADSLAVCTTRSTSSSEMAKRWTGRSIL
jgi:hypothetical protein